MKKCASNFSIFRYRSIVLVGITLAILSGLQLFEASAKTEISKNSISQNTTSGKIVYDALNGTFGSPQNRVNTANADGSGQITIDGGGFPAFSPCWSPDGKKIAYSNAIGDIVAKNADLTGSIMAITQTIGIQENNPVWSVTNKIAYERDNQIWVINSDGTNPIQFPGITQPTPKSPDWSPNGSKLAFTSGGDIWTINADGTNEQRITTGASNEIDPAWSSDGTKIVFARAEIGLFVINADGTNETLLTNNPKDIQPDWSPDGKKILFTRNTTFGGGTDGGIYVMNFDGTNQVKIIADTPGTQSNIRLNFNASWQPISAPRPTAFDFDGDNKTDISVFRPSSGAWYILSAAGLWVPVWGLSTDILVPEDYDGDQRTDVAVWRPSDGNFYILNSFDGTVRIENFGLSGDIPTGGDWDGDGKADPAVYREGSQSVFYYRGSMENPQGNITSIPWGFTGDKPVASDYDGDGKTDAAIYRNGDWYVYQSSTGQLLGISFGLPSDKLVPADYDGDGKTDFAVYRDGIWYQMRSSQGFAAFQFGISNDILAPADYDGDGKADAAIYRDGVWWILNSQNSTVQNVSLGISSDKPISSAFVR